MRVIVVQAVEDATPLDRLEFDREAEAPSIKVWTDRHVGTIPVEYHADMSTLVATGLPLAGELQHLGDETRLVIRLASLTTERPDPPVTEPESYQTPDPSQ